MQARYRAICRSMPEDRWADVLRLCVLGLLDTGSEWVLYAGAARNLQDATFVIVPLSTVSKRCEPAAYLAFCESVHRAVVSMAAVFEELGVVADEPKPLYPMLQRLSVALPEHRLRAQAYDTDSDSDGDDALMPRTSVCGTWGSTPATSSSFVAAKKRTSLCFARPLSAWS